MRPEPFDLADYLTDSLSLSANRDAPTRAMFPSTINNHYLEFCNADPGEILGLGVADPPRDLSQDEVGTPIQEFYRGLNILITGGTGFIGKTLTQKLIRSVPHLGHIYLLIRPKRGKSPSDRFKQLFEDHVFLRMKKEVPHFQELVTVVEGDIAEVDLGLSSADRHMLTEKVHVVFHSAADVRFVEPLRVAIGSNVVGSKRVMDLSRQMSNLKSYVHVSTAFSQCVRPVIQEAVPKMSISYQETLHYIDTKSDNEIQQDLTRILQGWPNTYTFSKALCEEMILEEGQDLPICIFRPAIVGPTYREPVRGWTDNLYGPTGILLGASMGIIHCFALDGEINLDAVPVDYTANCMIAAARHTEATSPRTKGTIHVYNFVLTAGRQFLWKSVVDQGAQIIECWPPSTLIWYPSFLSTKSVLLDAILHPILHSIPGRIIDAAASLAGQPQRLTKIYKRIDSLKSVLNYFCSMNWIFENENVMDLWNSLSPEDKKEFNFDLRDVDPIEHLLVSKLGTRYFYLKEKMDTIPSAVRRIKFFKVAHYSLKTISGLVLLKLLCMVAHVLPI